MKRLVSLIALLSGLIMILTACGDISLKSSSEDFVGKYYEEVVQELEESGFDNIELKEVEDLTSLSELSDGAVSDVIINNEKSFDSNTKFPEDSNAVVIYHVIPKVKVPISAEQLASEEVEGIISILSEAGFTNIQTEAFLKHFQRKDKSENTLKDKLLNRMKESDKKVLKLKNNLMFYSTASVKNNDLKEEEKSKLNNEIKNKKNKKKRKRTRA